MDTAYPILLPSIWSLIYKLQGTTQVNIIAKISLLYQILIVLLMTLSIYRKISKISAVSFLIMIYSHIITPAATSGYMDYPIAFVGSFSHKIYIFLKRSFGIKVDYKHSNTYYNTYAIHLLDI